MDMQSRRRFLGSMMIGATASPMLLAQQGAVPPSGRRGNRNRVPRPRPSGIVWISGQGANDGVPAEQKLKVTDPFEKHCTYTMDALKRSIERLGGTMDDFLYMQVFFCLPLDDSIPTPTGSAAFAAYQNGYETLGKIYPTYWQGTKYGAPPRSCFALSWIPGTSLLEMVGAAYIDPNAAPPAPPA
jgi:enamine deaminase RidA (YjgF/YER057c/UK114 family)